MLNAFYEFSKQYHDFRDMRADIEQFSFVHRCEKAFMLYL